MIRADYIFSQSPRPVRKNVTRQPHIFDTRLLATNQGAGLATISTVTIVLIAPVPLASNHPVTWLFWAAIIGLICTAVSIGSRQPLSAVPFRIRTILTISSCFIAFALFQAAPLPMLNGGLNVDFPMGQVLLPSISLAPGQTLIVAVRTASYVLFFRLALTATQVPARAKIIANTLLLGITLHAVLAILALKLFNDANFFAEKPAFFGMATGTFINKNSFATFLGMGIVLGLSLLRDNRCCQPHNRDVTFRYFYIFALGVILITLIMTQSRMGLIATLIAGSVVALNGNRPRYHLLLFITAAIMIGYSAYGLGLLDRFLGIQISASTRFELYRQIVAMILDRPLTGFGLGSFPLAYELYHAPPVTAEFVWDRAHSTYLTLWVEGGIFFGSLPILAGWLVMRHLYQRTEQAADNRHLSLAGYGAIILCAIHSLVDFSLEIQANAFLLIIMIALGIGSGRSQKGGY